MSSTARGVPGIESERVSAWLEEHVPGAVGPFSYGLVSGGRSNLTFDVTDRQGLRLILRRPPLGQVLESAHDMAREHRVLSALSQTSVPVAHPIALCEDPAVNGTTFYVMEFVEGAILRDEADVAPNFISDQLPTVAGSMVDALTDLHRVDPEEVGLGSLGPREGYVERQLRRWHRQWELARSRDIPAIDEVHRLLTAGVPRARGVSIVHGDYRIDNMIFGADATVRAILDWELCTLGDPMADVGLLAVYWVDPDEDTSFMLSGTPTLAPGFPTRREVLDAYAAATGADLSEINFYIALGYWKLACIAEGIYARYSTGAMGDDGVPATEVASQVPILAEAALAALEGDS